MSKTREQIRSIIIMAIGTTIMTLANEPHYAMQIGGDGQIRGDGEVSEPLTEEVSLATLCMVAPAAVQNDFLRSIPAAFAGFMLKELDEEDMPMATEIFEEIGASMNFWDGPSPFVPAPMAADANPFAPADDGAEIAHESSADATAALYDDMTDGKAHDDDSQIDG